MDTCSWQKVLIPTCLLGLVQAEGQQYSEHLMYLSQGPVCRQDCQSRKHQLCLESAKYKNSIDQGGTYKEEWQNTGVLNTTEVSELSAVFR